MHQLSNTRHEQIEKQAYRLWEERGRPWGSPEDDWLRAERECMQSSDSQPLPPLMSLMMEPLEY
jgi:hypothetical protein